MKKKIIMLKKVYDELWKNKKDPEGANLFLLCLELEFFYRKKGVKTSIANFTASGEEIGHFIEKNKTILQGLFVDRFSDPSLYLFTGKFRNESLDLLLGNLNGIGKFR